MQPRWPGYRAASELHCNESPTDGNRPDPATSAEAPARLAVSDSRGEVLPDLAREVAAERERAVHASIGLNGVSGECATYGFPAYR